MAFTPKQQNWHWYANDAAEPTSALAAENTAPSVALAASLILRLRLTIAETAAAAGSGAVSLEYSYDDSTFTAFGSTADWNYANGAATAGGTTTSFLTTDASTHGLYHETGSLSESWAASAVRELDFAITPRTTQTTLGTVYFRAKVGGAVVALNTGEAHPSLSLAPPQTGLNVPKGLAYFALSPPTGLNVPKGLAYFALSPPTGLNIAKALAYFVIQEGVGEAAITEAVAEITADVSIITTGGSSPGLFFCHG